MKKLLPWIIVLIVVVAIIAYVVWKKQKKHTNNEIVIEGSGKSVGFESQPGFVYQPTVILPISSSETPITVEGASLSDASCVNHSYVTTLIDRWKTSGSLSADTTKSIIRSVCPDAVKYLVRSPQQSSWGF